MNVDHDALVAALVQLEHHVGHLGFDQPPRLFALVRTATLIETEPELATQVGLSTDAPEGSLTAVEQDGFDPGDDLVAALNRIFWPETVAGVACSMVSSFLPNGVDAELPDDPHEAADYVAAHPDKVDLLVVAGAMRSGARHGVGRLITHPDDLISGDDLVPGFTQTLARTLLDDPTTEEFST
ncbi:PPA1309 family protein [Enemella sp. A6]|uniref:PPA1309 family protein n=1 Tax=Enemella sp. A6 TaxID=3440152 RepID=UPI003EBEE18D